MIEHFLTLEFIWFSAFVILLTGYAILDGFDLGVGMLHLFSKKDEERRIMLNTIGPVWDGNEVWLVTAGGALFAGFPHAYATLCSAFYIPMMVFLSGLIFRAVAIEFRSKQPMSWWRWMWDFLFSAASLVIAWSLGILMGNLVIGIPLDEGMEYMGGFFDLLTPYPFLVGFLTVSLFFMHGLLFVLMKTEGELHERMRSWVSPAMVTFVLFYLVTSFATLIYQPHMMEAIQQRPIFFGLVILNILVIARIPAEVMRGRDARAFLFSALNIVCLMSLYAVGTYPNVVRATNDPTNLSLTIWNSASSPKTLKILIFMAILGVPMVLSYTTAIYYIFRGKVKLDSHSY